MPGTSQHILTLLFLEIADRGVPMEIGAEQITGGSVSGPRWVDTADATVFVNIANCTVVSASPAAERMAGRSQEEMAGMPLHALVAENEAEQIYRAVRTIGSQALRLPDFHVKRGDGTLLHVRVSSAFVLGSGADEVLVVSLRDASSIAAQEDRLAMKKWALEVYAAASIALMNARTSEGLIREICEAITRNSPYPLAWVGFPEEGESKRIRHGISAGPRSGYLQDLYISYDEHSPLSKGPTGMAYRTGSVQVLHDIAGQCSFPSWVEHAERHDIRSVLSVPIDADEEGRAVLTVYSSQPRTFGHVVVQVFTHLAAQIGLGLQAMSRSERLKQEQAQREHAQQELSKALMGVVRAIITTQEIRDPYTTGHQEHVAGLACAISQELGMDELTQQAIQVAAQLHDIGKMSIPVEVLVKPGAPTVEEWKLLKRHPENGYRILQDVPFPGPVAELVLQHHERLDGSGYPRGLKAGEILPGAMVLAVADVVESMAAERPYRPARGIDEALAEIQRQAGRQLDGATVAACVRLFREQGFRLATIHA